VKLNGYFLPNAVRRRLFAWQKKFDEINPDIQALYKIVKDFEKV